MKQLLIQLSLGLHAVDVTKTAENELIKRLLNEGIITLEHGVYKIPSKFRAGTISLVQGGSAYLQAVALNTRDLHISSEDLLGAQNGDLVIAKRILGKRGAPSAKVVAIVGRERSYSIAIVQEKEGIRSLNDIKTGHPAGVETTQEQLKHFKIGTLLSIDNEYRSIKEALGNISESQVDEKIVLARYNKHDAFEEDVIALAKSFKKSVDINDYPHRKDLRNHLFCTIDPVTAKDFDDAICWNEKEHILHVAIADVSSYVTPFGPIDAEAIYRSFSIYLPHRSIPMLPRQLSETLCSLQPHVDRLAYVFELHLHRETLQVVKSELYEAVIHSHRRFNYDEVDALFEGKLQSTCKMEDDIFKALLQLRKVTDALKKKRMQNGFDFRSLDLEMHIDEEQNLVETTYAEETPSHALIEDCMLLANKAAAARYERGVFRIHEPPSQSKLQNLYQELAGIGIFVEPKESVHETILEIQEQAKLRDLQSEVDTLIIRAQMQARYAPENAGHFGLGFEQYTHFTSPIRRYSDLIVHRLLKAIASNNIDEGAYVLRNIEALCMSISEKEREASSIEVEFKQRKFARWAQQHIGEEFQARINGTDPELTAELHDTIMGAKLYITSTVPVMLFDDVTVTIDRADLLSAKIYATVLQKADAS
jgi:ribonuclease R